jgi:predicted nucleic acid-binding protein
VESLGFPHLGPAEEDIIRKIFRTAVMLPIDQQVLDGAVTLKQQRRMSLGDALIAATALVHDLTLVTRNTADFRWVPNLRLHDPLAPPPATP